MTSAFCLFVFETFVSRLLALFGTIITSESGNPTPPGDKWERKLLVFGIFYSFLTSGRPLSSSTDNYLIIKVIKNKWSQTHETRRETKKLQQLKVSTRREAHEVAGFCTYCLQLTV